MGFLGGGAVRGGPEARRAFRSDVDLEIGQHRLDQMWPSKKSATVSENCAT